MSHIYRSLPPAGTRIGIAFSGGLDTRAAVAWLAEQGLSVHGYTADLAQPDEADAAAIPAIALDHGAQSARLVDCRDALVREGLIAIQCGAFHLRTGGKTYFNTTPLGRAVTTVSIVTAMRDDDVHVFGDGSTHKGRYPASARAPLPQGAPLRCREAGALPLQRWSPSLIERPASRTDRSR